MDGPDEEYANAFAAALLMPEQPFRREWKRCGDTSIQAVLLSIVFSVPAEYVHYRAEMLGLA